MMAVDRRPVRKASGTGFGEADSRTVGTAVSSSTIVTV